MGVRVVFAGSGDIGLPSLRWLSAGGGGHQLCGVITQPDRPAGRGRELQEGPVKQAASVAGVPVLQPAHAADTAFVEELRALRPEGVVVCAYGQILKQAFLDLPPLGCVNLHASLLPRHRGASCIAAALLEGDTESGMTLMRVERGLDTGAVLLQEAVAIGPQETAGSLHDRLAELGPGLLERGLALMETGQAEWKAQDASRATYAPKMEKEAGRLDWGKPAAYLERHVRAMAPWPSAFTFFEEGGREVRLKIGPPVLVEAAAGEPGTVLGADGGGIVVACGEGSLRITVLQREGKKAMAAGEFLRGCGLGPGFVLR